MLALALRLPWQIYPRGFNIFIDNAYASIRALYVLRLYEIAATETARSNQKDYLPEHKGINREKDKWWWGAQSSIVVTNIGDPGSGKNLRNVSCSADQRVLSTM